MKNYMVNIILLTYPILEFPPQNKLELMEWVKTENLLCTLFYIDFGQLVLTHGITQVNMMDMSMFFMKFGGIPFLQNKFKTFN